MLLSLRNDHKEHLHLLTKQPTEVVVDFCKLAIDFLHNGVNNKLYTSAARKLEVEPEVVENCVYGLVNLLLLSCKHLLSEADFRDSVLTLGFSNEQQSILFKFYETKRPDIVQTLKQLSVSDSHYSDLQWRFEVQVSTRSLLTQTTPLIAMDLTLKNDDISTHKLVQIDPASLLHVTQELETALMESRSRYSRKLQRTFLE